MYILLRRESWRDNKKRVYRVYKEEGGTCTAKDSAGARLVPTGWNALPA
jgi:hypothetical protein